VFPRGERGVPYSVFPRVPRGERGVPYSVFPRVPRGERGVPYCVFLVSPVVRGACLTPCSPCPPW
jgi:hypothetical protein